MTRLVVNRAKRLDEEKMGTLWSLIDRSRSKDESFFKLCKDLRTLLQYGHTGELDKMPKNERVVVNLAHGHIRQQLPSLFFREPNVRCTPSHPIHEGHERTWESLINSTIKRIGFKKEAKDVILDALVYPEGWLKSFHVNEVPEAVLQGSSSKARSDVAGPRSETGGQVGPAVWLTSAQPSVARVSPLQVVVDYRSNDRSLATARFIDFQYLKTVNELKADPLYRDQLGDLTDDATYTGTDSVITPRTTLDPFSLINDLAKEDVGTHDKYVILHEVWVYQLVGLNLYKQLVCLIEGTDGLVMNKVIRLNNGAIPSWEEVLGAYAHEYPVSRIIFNPIPDVPPASELGVWSGMHSAVNWLMSRFVSLVDNQKKIYTLKTGGVANAEKAKAQFKAPGTRVLIEVNEHDAIAAVQEHGSTRDDTGLFQILMELIRRVSGVTENQLGGDKFRTATAAANASQSSAIRTEEAVDVVKDFLLDAILKIVRMSVGIIQGSGDTSFVLRTIGDTGSVEWLELTRDEFYHLPDIDIDVASFRKPRKEEEAQKALMALQATLQAMAGGATASLDILLRTVYEALEIPNIGKILDSERDQVMLQSLEMGLLLAGQEVPINQTDNHAVHVRVIDMFLNWMQGQAGRAGGINEGALNSLMVHRDQHQQLLEQMTSQVSTSSKMAGDNLFDTTQPTAANQARSETARERESAQPVAGTGGQF